MFYQIIVRVVQLLLQIILVKSFGSCIKKGKEKCNSDNVIFSKKLPFLSVH